MPSDLKLFHEAVDKNIPLILSAVFSIKGNIPLKHGAIQF